MTADLAHLLIVVFSKLDFELNQVQIILNVAKGYEFAFLRPLSLCVATKRKVVIPAEDLSDPQTLGVEFEASIQRHEILKASEDYKLRMTHSNYCSISSFEQLILLFEQSPF